MNLVRIALYSVIALSLQIATAMSFVGTDKAMSHTSSNAPSSNEMHHAQMQADDQMDNMDECCPKPCDQMPDCADMCATSANNSCSTSLKQAAGHASRDNRAFTKLLFTPTSLAAIISTHTDRQPKPPKA
ncbi:MAG: hypothetical protein RLN89_09190 [Parvibaculum sp.]